MSSAGLRQEPRGTGKWLIVLGGLLGAGLATISVGQLLPPENPPARAVPSALALASSNVTAGPSERTQARAEPTPSAGRPTEPRRSEHPLTVQPELTSVYEWPREPEAPREVDEKRFAGALALLCGPYADKHAGQWFTPWILRAAHDFGADPFLLGALAFHMTGCVAKKKGHRIGLAGLDTSLYRRDLQGRQYAYRVFDDGAWQARAISLARFPFERRFLASAESNLYFAAGMLRAWQEQARGLRAAFPQPSEYRHYVSHYIWGDLVQSHRDEDHILVERRRLLEYYGALPPRPPVRFHGFSLGCPLDGCPRVVTSTLGDSRAGGTRLHMGNDFESTRGEPVRAIGRGTVLFAGVDLPGRGAAAKIPIWAQRGIDPATMGAGGLYVCIDHGVSREGEQLVSCNMHLDVATVAQGRVVERGEEIGRVGLSGIKESRPHLHFELHSSKGVHRATEVLTGLALGNPVTHAPPVSMTSPTAAD